MKKLVLTIFFTCVFYLVQVCIMPHLPLFAIVPNALLACIAIVGIAYSPFFAFVSGAMSGIITEVMIAPFDYFNLIVYPVLALLGSFVFSDKSEAKKEREKMLNSKRIALSPQLRTIFCAGLMSLVKEVLHRIYIYLIGEPITSAQLLRIAIAVIYTMAITFFFMIPTRSILGVRKRRKAPVSGTGGRNLIHE